MKTKTLSRRAALAGAVSLAPAAAVAAVPIGTDSDAELIAVGEQLTALFKRVRELWDFLAPSSDELLGHMHDAAHEVMKVRESGDSKAADELWAVRMAENKQMRQSMGPKFAAADEEHQRVLRALDEPFNDLDLNDNFVRDVIEAVLAFAGEPLPFAAPDATGRVVASASAIARVKIDPIFAAIEKHREAWQAFAGAASAAGDLQEELVNRGEHSNENAAYVDAQARADALGEVAEELKEALLETKPATLAGALAVIRYINGYNHGHYHDLFEDEEYATFLTTIGDTIQEVIERGAVA